MLVLAPGLFSITTVWPRRSPSLAANSRPMTSVEPPGGNGTTIVIGLDGYVSADASSGVAARAHTASALETAFFMDFPLCCLE
ncbi:hypothetical protein D3C72_2070570 [compost metagenome]